MFWTTYWMVRFLEYCYDMNIIDVTELIEDNDYGQFVVLDH
jgi:hypothetical protein